ncbi:MAG: HU family DNA-binding protein [Legionellaceae bacterium]|nr:HU family DNA-binding protein [Legionellaceae bacterium]
MTNYKGEEMNKSELIDAIADGAGLTKVAASKVLEVFTRTVTDALKSGDQVVLPGFGSFSTSVRSARTGRNPQTGQTIDIKAARVAKFKAGKSLKEAVGEK